MSVPARFIHIGFKFSGVVPPMADLEKVFNLALDWIRFDTHCWIVYSNTELDTWRDRIRNIDSIGASDAFFLTEFNSYSGYQTKDVWEFLQKAR